MTDELLQQASESLRVASAAASGDNQRQLYQRSNALAEMATDDVTISSGELDELLNTLEVMKRATEDASKASIQEAQQLILERKSRLE
jgi:replication-associated recombination protein RarA